MPDYLVFGSCLRSELPFPELAESRGREPKWTLTLGSLDSDHNAEMLSDTRLSENCRIRISRAEDRIRFSHSCGGTFELRDHGKEIVFDADRAASVDAARTDLVARLLLMAGHDHIAWLHGSAARIGQTAIGFIGVSGAGKSTLALALTRAGAEHICDDALPIEPGNPPMVWASDGTVRMCGDTKRNFAPRADSVRRESDGKFVVRRSALETGDAATRGVVAPDRNGEERLVESRTPLGALYVLAPARATALTSVCEVRVSRRLIAPSAAVGSLIQNLKLGALVSPDYPARKMEQIAAIVRVVPVFELTVPRDWSRLSETVSQLLDWHTPGLVAAINPHPSGAA